MAREKNKFDLDYALGIIVHPFMTQVSHDISAKLMSTGWTPTQKLSLSSKTGCLGNFKKQILTK
jgi:hypothetical protein